MFPVGEPSPPPSVGESMCVFAMAQNCRPVIRAVQRGRDGASMKIIVVVTVRPEDRSGRTVMDCSNAGSVVEPRAIGPPSSVMAICSELCGATDVQ